MLPGPNPEKKPEMAAPRRQPPAGPQGQRPPQPPQRRPPPLRPPPRPRRHHHGKASRARLGLVVMFVLFRLLDFMFLMGTPPELNRSLLSSTITGGLWTTALLIAIAMRKAWARLILLALLGLAAVFTIIVLPLAFDYPSLWMPLGAFLLVNAGSFAWLSYSRDVRRLISRDRE